MILHHITLLLNYHSEKPNDPDYEGPEEFQLQELPTEPVYEEPTALFQLQKNVAYEIPPSRIETTQNEAYGTISNS